jgi:hypothetical protein
MKLFALAASVSLFMSVGNAMAQIHHWPATDPDPYFKKRDLQRYAATKQPEYPLHRWTDTSDPYGGYPRNSRDGNRAFWDYQSRNKN